MVFFLIVVALAKPASLSNEEIKLHDEPLALDRDYLCPSWPSILFLILDGARNASPL